MLQIRRERLKSIKICNDTAWVKRMVLSEKNIAGAKQFEKSICIHAKACIQAMKNKFLTLRSCNFNKLKML